MRTRKLVRRLTAIAVGCFIFLLGYSFTGWSEEGTIPVRMPPESRAQSLLKLLQGFNIIPGTAVLVEGGYVIALFKNPEKDLYALVSFSADCDGQSCTIKDLVTYALFGKRETDPHFARA